MRPTSLNITAFGPFPGSESIDFTMLGENPLFLINGPTGAGKTTILDAICFALYGKTTGDEREGAQMRCGLAAGDLLTEVSLEFEFSGRRFRIRRVPEQQRPKARGEGTTTQSPEAQLVELLADGSEKLLVASKVSDATREIEELTGLSVDQFRQVMVLPQGKFRQLLMADSNEREKIFGQLFQTRIYKRLEEGLKQQAADIRKKREEQQLLQQGILKGAELESAEALEEELASCEPACTEAMMEKDAKELSLSEAEKQLLQAKNLERDFARLEKAAADLQRLEGERERIDEVRAKITRAEQADRLHPIVADRTRCEGELSQAKQEAETADARLRKASEALEIATRDWEATGPLQTDLAQATEASARLKGYGDRVARLAATRAALQKAERSAAQADLVLRFKGLADAYLAIHTLEQQQKKIEQQQGAHAEAQRQEEARRRDHAERERTAKNLELAWHQGQAAILARELQAGTPCPVCGSTTHPAPAPTDLELPNQQQVDSARTEVQNAANALDAAKSQTTQEQERLRDLEREAQSLRTATQVDITLAELKGAIGDVQEEARRLDLTLPNREQVPQLDAEELRSARESTRSAAAAARAQMETAEQELPEAYREQGTLDAAIAQATTTIGRLEGEMRRLEEQYQGALHGKTAAQTACDAAAGQLKKAETALSEARRRTAETLAASPFADEEAYRAALLDDRAQTRLNQQVSTFDRNLAELSGAKKQLNEQLTGVARPDLALLETARAETETARDLARDAWQQLDKRLSILTGTKTKLARAAADRDSLDAHYAVIGTLSDVANGQTGDKISLQRFVLSVLLDDVLIEASRRLNLMSKGRYVLLRKEDRAKGNKASGLELEVEDAYDGKVRPVATLSGGESFMAALSMALGLSDVVQAYAGGIRLDTLFIDEGFGSLDAESLDLAVRTLIDLQAAGRMIGVISHVAELKEQMPLRLDVLAGRDGSRVRLVAP